MNENRWKLEHLYLMISSKWISADESVTQGTTYREISTYKIIKDLVVFQLKLSGCMDQSAP